MADSTVNGTSGGIDAPQRSSQRRRGGGPRLGTKILLLALTLLVIPWFSYRQLVETERLLIEGQKLAQLKMAEGISTLFNDRVELFNDLPVTLENYESLFAHSLEQVVRIDGEFGDWGEALSSRFLSFGSESGTEDGDFQILLGERGGQLHAFLSVRDGNAVFRRPDHLRLDLADHIRVTFIRNDGEDARIAFTFQEPGITTAYQMDGEWRFAEQGTPVNDMLGFVRLTDTGYEAELRLPLDMLGSRRYFGVTVVDVDDPVSGALVHATQTLPTAGKESFNLVVLRSTEVLKIVEGLGFSGARILVLDAKQRVRAETGTYAVSDTETDERHWYSRFGEWFQALRPILHYLTTGEELAGRMSERASQRVVDRSIEEALEGQPIALRRMVGKDQEVIIAAHPIVSSGGVLGAVVLEQNIEEILAFQRSTIERGVLFSIASLFAVFIALLAFAARLAWRIRNLRREASAAIDSHGRLRTSSLRSEMDAGDEIGDLARSVSNMLTKLHQHNTFLETMPRTLRHEINNPLNVLSTSLQNLASEVPEVADSKYLESAKRGVLRIGMIVQNLADAASLEDSLEAEELEVIDIQELLQSYVANCRITHQDCSFVYRGTTHPVHANVSDFRIEQLMDKIIDNAIDFHRGDSPIKIQLDTYRDYLQITVANRGPVLPEGEQTSLFDSMVTHRGPQNRLHFGLGLYVVRVIAEHHGGFVRAMNLIDGSGVAIVVQLPVVRSGDMTVTGETAASIAPSV